MLAGAAGYLWEQHWDVERRVLSRVTAGPDGVTSDYAAAALGFVSLSGALGDADWLARAIVLLERAIELFGAPDGDFFDSTA